MKFEPDLHLYEEALVNAYDLMLRSVSAVPRVETLLYPEEVRQRDMRSPVKIFPFFTSSSFLQDLVSVD